jgi:uncharacterized lipoprotein YddW (UPF0748 family)
VWVATVANMDWPSKRTLTTAAQQAELLAILDRAAALRLNAVIFQVRPSADALYASTLEPWSEYLTGTPGKAPSPFWDPLAFAVREAHARGLELHAWFNPFRARYSDVKARRSRTHVARSHPEWVRSYGGFLWMDPGESAVRKRTVQVVLDVVRRYDVDGVHFDDYFYPYPATDRRGRTVPFPDDRSFQRYRRQGGSLDRGDWRRRNVNLLVEELGRRIHDEKPWVRFGISPFGIWRPGHPVQVRGLDAYSALYADSRRWLREGWVDYLAPQLYWPTTRPQQSYGALLEWWAAENVQQRHLWPGNFTSQAGARGSGSFPLADLFEQIRVTREMRGAGGNIHFSMRSFLRNQGGMNDSLRNGPYAEVALAPATPWLSAPEPPAPAVRLLSTADGAALQLRRTGRGAPPWQWLVRLRTDSAWISVVVPGATARWTLPASLAVTSVAVASVNRIGMLSSIVTLPVPPAANASHPSHHAP